MKKRTILVSLLALSTLSISIVNKERMVFASNEVAISSINPSDIVGGYDIATSIVDDGIKAVLPGADTVGNAAWQKQLLIPNNPNRYDIFSIKNNNHISLEFSAKLFDNSGSVISQSVNSGGAFDIYMYDASTNNQLAIVRIFTSAGGALNGDHSYELYYGSGWGNKVEGSSWIKGDATANSSFRLDFDTENMFQSYTSAKEDLATLDDDSQTYKTNAKSVFEGVDQIYFKMMGNNGFTNNTEIVVRSINGQSLSNSNGNFIDTIAPRLNDEVVAETIPVNQEYEILTTASDLFGDVSYSLNINDEVIEGKKFTPNTDGNLNVILQAKDSAGNVSEKEFNFVVVSNIAKPVITDVASIWGGKVELFSKKYFDMPTYTDETGSASVELKIYKGDELVATLTPNASNKFELFVPANFEEGDYQFVYEVTNSAGTTASEPIDVSYTVGKGYECGFVVPLDENIVCDYVNEGLRIRTAKSYVETDLGLYDISNGFDMKYIINATASNNASNDTSYFNMIFQNEANPNYRAVYRVWSSYSGADCATNVYISTNGWQTFNDITDTGWINRNVDDVNGKYHMGYDPDETFIGERTGGIQRVDNAYQALVEFFESAPSNYYHVFVETSKLDAPNPTNNYEVIISEINGQSLANTNGVINQVNDATLVIKGLKEVVQINDTIKIDAYAKDIFADISTRLEITDPNGNKSNHTINNNELFDYEFDVLGDYQLEFITTGTNGKDVKVSKKVSVKSSVADINLSINGSYNSLYSVGDKITILGTTVSDNVVNQVITISNSKESKTLKVGDEYTFEKSGIYTITYEAFDDATPTPNKATETITINVPDTTNPVVEVVLDEKISLNSTITPNITIVDESEYDVKVVLTTPSKTETLKSKDNYAFEVLEEGEYKLTITVEDIYSNKTTITKTFTATSSTKKGCKGEVATSMFALVSLAALLSLKKRK